MQLTHDKRGDRLETADVELARKVVVRRLTRAIERSNDALFMTPGTRRLLTMAQQGYLGDVIAAHAALLAALGGES